MRKNILSKFIILTGLLFSFALNAGNKENFNNFERFENNILRKYPSSELGYLKDNDTATVFEYVLEPF